jgi:hypothetical protein
MATFSSAWMIYVSICFSYDSERGPALSHWTERLVHYYQGFEWYACLNYAIGSVYREASEFTSEGVVFTDPELVTEHFVGAERNASTAPQHSQSSSKKPYERSNPASRDVRQNWNRPIIGCKYKVRFDGDACGRRHVCSTCHRNDHKAYECPTKSKPID